MFRPIVILIAISLITGNVGRFSPAGSAREGAFPQSAAVAPVKPRKRALLVGVSDYCRDKTKAECKLDGKYWWDLNSANDVDAIAQILMSQQFGFKQEEIKVFKSKAETTGGSIINTFKSFLIEQTGPGDIVYFHYSGHGSQVQDDADETHGVNPKLGDELDGFDESLIPSDYEDGRTGRNDIRDDDLEQLLSRLGGRHVTVTVDSCYSGTITRGGRSLVRGMKRQTPGVANTRGAKDGPSGIFAAGATLPASVVVMSAARNNQSASETVDKATRKAMGAFSSSLVSALRNTGPETTYRDLFEKVSDEITREIGGQDPQLEGSRDNVLFSGIARPPQPYINVLVKDRKVMLKAGSLQGMTKGSRFSVYGPGKDSKTSSPMAQGEITALGPTMSVLKLTPAPGDKALEELRTARAVEAFHNFGDLRLKVLLDETAKAMLGGQRLSALKTLDLVSVADRAGNWNVRVCRGRCEDEKLSAEEANANFTGGVTLMREDGSIIRRIADGPKTLDEIKTTFEGEARWRLVKGLKNESDPDLRLKMRLVPITDIVQDPNTKLAIRARDLAPEVQPADGNQLVLHDGDLVMLEVMNLGTVELYVSVLDLRSNGVIAPLFPHPLISIGLNDNNIKIKNDSNGNPVWQRIPCPFVFKIGKPYGHEVFRAIITREPADFSPLFRRGDAEDIQRGQRRGTTRGENEAKSPLGQLLLTATTGKTRGQRRAGSRGDPSDDRLLGAVDAANIGVPLEDWATAEINFEARPPRAAHHPFK